MGYRSDVYIKVHKSDEDKLVEVLEENSFEAIREYSSITYVGYTIYDVKWYSSYDEVKAVNRFIKERDNYLRGLIAIGEDNDTEEYGEPSEIGLFTITKIVWR